MMHRPLPPLELLLKPVGARCNLACTYCHYTGPERAASDPAPRTMPTTVLERTIASYLALEQPLHSFCWQGGEPLLAGLDFYRTVLELQRRHARPRARVANSLQTNGCLLDDAAADFLAAAHVLVGCSLDGPPDVHDRYRRDHGRRPSHADVMRGINRLRRRGVTPNILVLVSQANVTRGAEVYRYLRDLGFRHLQFIPCVERLADGKPAPYAITGSSWGDFLVAVFEQWRRGDQFTVSVRNFDAVMVTLAGGGHQLCTTGVDCGASLVVETSGDVYPCDFYVAERWRLGNIMTDSWQDLRLRLQDSDWRARKTRYPEVCARCEVLGLCHGDCPRNRAGAANDGPSLLCQGWRRFLDHAGAEFKALACPGPDDGQASPSS